MTGSVFDLSATAGSNSTIEGVNVGEGCPAANLNDGLRGLAAAVRNTFSSALQSFLAGSSALPVANGGTGGTSAATARTTLGAAASGANSDITSLAALSTPLSIAQGGTGASDAATARTNLGVLAVTSSSNVENNGYRSWSDGYKECWGYVDVGQDSSASVSFPISYSTWVNVTLGAQTRIGTNESENTGFSGSPTTSGFTIYNAQNQTIRVWWQAKGA